MQLPVPIGRHGVEQQAARDGRRQIAGNGQRCHGERGNQRQDCRPLPQGHTVTRHHFRRLPFVAGGRLDFDIGQQAVLPTQGGGGGQGRDVLAVAGIKRKQHVIRGGQTRPWPLVVRSSVSS